jgi:hypothetical protein
MGVLLREGIAIARPLYVYTIKQEQKFAFLSGDKLSLRKAGLKLT